MPPTSNINYGAGQTASNAVVAKLAANGRIAVTASAGTSVDVLVDVTGYWNPAGGGIDGATFNPLTGVRLADTRPGINTGACPTVGSCTTIAAGGTLTLQVAGQQGIPATTVGTAAVNVTVISPAGSGYLTVYPDGDPQPATSNLNYTAGQTRAQLSVTKLGATGRLRIYASTSVNVIVDGQGWATVAGADNGSTYTASNPVRVLDTRSASRAGQCATTPTGATLLANCTTLTADAVRYVQISGQGGVPAGVKAVAVNLTATTTAATGYLIAWPAAAAVPATSNLNYSTGQTISNSAIIELDNLGRLAVKAAAGGADVLIDVAGWYGDPAAVSYTYNANGAQTVKTTTGAGAATISYVWDPQGRLCNTIKAAAVNPGCTTQPAATATTRNTYTGDGQRLLRRDTTTTAGVTSRTLYLDGQELTSNNGATATATRYYSAGGATVAVRNASGLTWLFGDHQGTASITINSTTNVVTRQRYTPYGSQRGTPNKLDTTTERGFLSQTEDNNTGLTYLNARFYDPNLTRFISVDPLAFANEPQTLNPYAYAGNNPATYADPTGLEPRPTDGSTCQENYGPDANKYCGSSGGETPPGNPSPIPSGPGPSGHLQGPPSPTEAPSITSKGGRVTVDCQLTTYRCTEPSRWPLGDFDVTVPRYQTRELVGPPAEYRTRSAELRRPKAQ